MPNPNQPPFRMPCEGVAGKPLAFFGGPFAHALGPDKRPVFNNTTAVPNFNTDVGGTIGPYERPTPDDGGDAGCAVHQCVEEPNARPCSQWPLPFPTNVFLQDPVSLVDFAVGHKRGFKNVQARRFWSGGWGYMNLEASNSPNHLQNCDGFNTYANWRDYVPVVHDTKYTTLTITAEDKEQQYNYDPVTGVPTTQVNWDDTASVSQEIDANSGLLTVTAMSVLPNTDLNRALADLPRGLWNYSQIIGQMAHNKLDGDTITGTDNSITVMRDFGFGPIVEEQVNWDLAAGTFTRNTFTQDGSGAIFPLEVESVTVSDSEFAYSWHGTLYEDNGTGTVPATDGFITVNATLGGANTSAGIYADAKFLLSLWPLDDDALYPWRRDLKTSVAPLVSRDEVFTTGFNIGFWVKDFGAPIDNDGHTIGDPAWTGHCALVIAQDPNTGATTVAIDLPDVTSGDAISTGVPGLSFTPVTGYSVRGTLPPGVTFDATTGLISGTAGATGHFGVTVTVTGAAPLVTGDIRGAPLPAGHQDYFNFNFRDWIGCCFRPPDNPGSQSWDWYQVGWGGNVGTFNVAAGTALPLNAAQWTNFFQAVNKPQGAFLFYNDQRTDYFPSDCISSDGISGALDGQALWAGKYAEILELWPSQNFARPAGDDKFWFDEDRVFCATLVSGSGAGATYTLVDPVTTLAPPDDTDFSGIWGGVVAGGFYHVASYSGGTLTLGSKVYDVPSNWASKSNSDEAMCFGKLRFDTAPALLGRVAITPDVAGTTFTFAAAQPAFGLNSITHQEQVDLFDENMTPVIGNITATRVDDTHFTIVGPRANARFAMSHGAPAWYMNDTAPKGDYALLEWLADNRSSGEFARLNGVLDCAGAQVAQPSHNVGGGPIAQPFASFTQTAACLPFVPCSPKVVCISPNREDFPNGKTYAFPDTFALDDLYGSKWWAWVQSIMTDLLWQRPHRPCNIEPCARWQMDGGTCQENSPGSCPGDDDFIDGESEPPVFIYAHAPQVEARLSVPCNYGLTTAGPPPVPQHECAPALPAGIQIGWLSPVTNTTGDVALPPVAPGALSDRGEPAGANTAWDLHATFCDHAAGCRFHYTLPGC